jgi:hypothetical protein
MEYSEVILARPKAAFPIPLKEWLQNTLAAYCRDVYSSNSAKSSGIYDGKEMEMLLTAIAILPPLRLRPDQESVLFFDVATDCSCWYKDQLT